MYNERAILFSGDLRTYFHTAQLNAKVFGNCDVYFSVWDDLGYCYKMNDPWHHRIPVRTDEPVTEDLIVRLTPKGFNIKAIEIQNKDSIKHPFQMKKDNHLLFQYYKMIKVVELLEKEYKELVRMRCDVTVDSVKFIAGEITFANYIWYNKLFVNGITQQMNEMLFMGDPEKVITASMVYNTIKRISDRLPENKIHGESLFYHYLNSIALLDDSFNLHDFNYRIWR